MADKHPTTRPNPEVAGSTRGGRPAGASTPNPEARIDQARAAVGNAAAKTQVAATKARESVARTVRKAGDAVSGRGKVIAATAGVVAATAAGVAAVKALRARSSKSGESRVYHVQPQGEDWQVTIEGNGRPTGIYGTKKQAISAGRTMAQKHEPSRLIIHGGDGTVQRTHSYGEA